MNFRGFELLKALVAVCAVGAVLAGCSAGGASCSDTNTCTNTTTPVVTTPTIAVALSSSTVTTGAPATVTATVTNANGSPVVGNIVNFSVSSAVGLLSATSALTDSTGHAVVLLSPAVGAPVGADVVSATSTVAGTLVTATAGYQTSAVTAGFGTFATDLGASAATALAPYGQSDLTLTVTGTSAASPAAITVNSDCVTRGKATISPATTTNTTGVSTFIYKDTGGCGSVLGNDTITASITGSSVAPATLKVFLTPPKANSVTFDSASPPTIYLKGSGYAESSVVKFKVVDTAGNALPGQQVDLSLSTFAGGILLDNKTEAQQPLPAKTSDADGFVSVIVNSGTVPTPVRVIATLDGTTISTVSNNLSIVTGLPAQLQFSLSEKTINIEGNDIDGTTNTYTVRAADRSGNPVPDGTSVIFWAEGGQIQGTASTLVSGGIASATASFVSQSPRPQDGRATIVAYAIGEESFIDQNGNNVWDAGEPFQDLGDVVKDGRYDGVFDSSVDEFVSLSQLGATNNSQTCVDQSATYPQFAVNDPSNINGFIPSRPGTCDGTWSGKTYVRRAVETVFSTSLPNLLWAGRSTSVTNEGLDVNCTTVTKYYGPPTLPLYSAAKTYYTVSGDPVWYTGGLSQGTLNFIVGDRNTVRLNPMAAGTTISVGNASPGLSVTLLGGSPIPSTGAATAAGVGYAFTTATSGTFSLTVTSPSSTALTYQISVVATARPSACTN